MEQVKKVGKVAPPLFNWAVKLVKYQHGHYSLIPRQTQLSELQAEAAVIEEQLSELKSQYATLEAQYLPVLALRNEKAEDLEDLKAQIEVCRDQNVRANKLLDSLGDEK